MGLVGCAPAVPLADTWSSAEEAATAVLQALGERDRARLMRLSLNEAEFREHVWPELPAARPERNLPFGYVWSDLRQKSEASLAATLANHGGRQYRFKEVRFAGETTRYQSYAVHREGIVRVTLPDGSEEELKLFGSMFEKDGRWKIFSYVTD